MLGALIGAGATLAGGLFNKGNQDKQARLQEKFAKHGIQWRVADAAKAGVSKLYALGANTASYSPVSVGGGIGDALSASGQNIGRAIDATASPAGRAGHLATQIAETQLEGLKLDNDIRRQSILSTMAQRGQPGTGPPIISESETTPMVPGQGNAKLDYKLERRLQPAATDQPHRVHGVSPEVDLYRTTRGYSPEVPQQLGESHESQPLAAFQWFMRNRIAPTFNTDRATHPYPAPAGQVWRFDPLFGEYTLVPIRNIGQENRRN